MIPKDGAREVTTAFSRALFLAFFFIHVPQHFANGSSVYNGIELYNYYILFSIFLSGVKKNFLYVFNKIVISLYAN